MKYTHLFVAVALTVSVKGATINANSISPGAPGASAFFDNAGNPLAGGSVLVFSGQSPTDLESAVSLFDGGSALAIIPFDNISPGGGLVSGALEFDNTDGSQTGADLFALFSNAAGTEFVAYDLSSVLLAADTATAPVSVFEQLSDSSLVTLGNVVEGPVDNTALSPGTPPGQGFNVFAVAIPEPSSALLAGLALVGGLVRRRR